MSNYIYIYIYSYKRQLEIFEKELGKEKIRVEFRDATIKNYQEKKDSKEDKDEEIKCLREENKELHQSNINSLKNIKFELENKKLKTEIRVLESELKGTPETWGSCIQKQEEYIEQLMKQIQEFICIREDMEGKINELQLRGKNCEEIIKEENNAEEQEDGIIMMDDIEQNNCKLNNPIKERITNTQIGMNEQELYSAIQKERIKYTDYVMDTEEKINKLTEDLTEVETKKHKMESNYESILQAKEDKLHTQLIRCQNLENDLFLLGKEKSEGNAKIFGDFQNLTNEMSNDIIIIQV